LAGGIGGGRSLKNCALALNGHSNPNSTSIDARRTWRLRELWPVRWAFMGRFFTENAANSSLRTGLASHETAQFAALGKEWR